MDIVGTVLSAVASHHVWFFIALAVVVLLILVAMTLILMRGNRLPPALDKAMPEFSVKDGAIPAVLTEAVVDPTQREVRGLFRRGVAAYRETLSRNLYLVPWFVRVGSSPSPDGGLLACYDELRPPVGGTRAAGFSWRFYDRAVVIDVDDARVAWRGVLDHLARHRSLMPLDGVIVTIPLADLGDVATATARGTDLYGQLWEVQRTLGFTVPIFVVVTGCEGVAGFTEFADHVPETLRRSILGWSSPYPLATAFSADVIGQAMQAVSDALLAVELEIFGSLGVDNGMALVRMSERVATLTTPLQALLGTAFRRTVYQESLYFRGLYFIGRSDPTAAATFGRDLLSRKVFSEGGLSKPSRSLAAARTWRRYAGPAAAATVAAIGLLLLVIGYRQATQLSDRLVPILADLPGGLQRVSDQRPSVQSGAGIPPTFTDPAARFVQTVAALPDQPAVSVLPAAWFSDVRGSVARALAVGYRRLAVATARDVIEDRLRRLARDGVPSPRMASGFDGVKALAAEIGITEGVVQAFNAIDGQDPRFGVDDVLNFAFSNAAGSGVADGFESHLQPWMIAIPPAGGMFPAPGPSSQHAIDVSAYRSGISARFRSACDRYFRELAQGGLSSSRLSVAATELALLSDGHRSGLDAAVSFAEVSAAFNEAAHDLSIERGMWIGADAPVFAPDFDALLVRLETSQLLEAGLRNDMMDLAQRRFNEAGAGAKSLDSVIGKLLSPGPGPNDPARLSTTAEGLRQVLSSWQARRFMRVPDPRQPALMASAEAVNSRWDRAVLETVPPLIEDFLLFETKDLVQVPSMLRASMQSAAQAYLEGNVNRVLSRALVPSQSGPGIDRGDELSQLRDQARSLRLAFPVLGETMQAFRQVGLAGQADVIRNVVQRQANALFLHADRLLEADQLYVADVRALRAWSAGPLAPYTLFGQGSNGSLVAYLANSRQEVTTLGREIVAPVIEILSTPVMGGAAPAGLATKWTRIITELDKYDGGRPNSSLMALEKFIVTDAAAIDFGNCQTIPPGPGSGGDFFQGRHQQLRQQILGQCRMASDVGVYNAYSDLSALFNKTLAGRFPFAAGADTGNEADIGAVAAFYDALDAHLAAVTSGLGQLGASGRDAGRFIETMIAARGALTAMSITDQTGGILLDPAFRVNRDREIGSRDILEWRLATPAGFISNLLPRAALRWYSGDPIALTLRWAKDGPVTPAAGQGPALSSINGQSLSYSYKGPWALFAMLRGQSTSPRDRRPVVTGETTLMFEAETRSVPRPEGSEVGDAAAARAAKQAAAAASIGSVGNPMALLGPTNPDLVRVYVGLTARRTVVAEGKAPRDERVDLPELPTRAPVLTPGGFARNPESGAVFPGAMIPEGSSGGNPVAAIDRALFDLGDPSNPGFAAYPFVPPGSGAAVSRRTN
ncbi:MAG: type VI secretion system protein [Azospirillaceae bacterium]|nr:type VI secretion system protein [Azospirillaceae bacterium]